MNTIQLNFAGLNVSLTTNFPGYYSYLSDYFEKIISSETSAQHIHITFDWSEESLNTYLGGLKASGRFTTIGANTLTADNEVATVRKLERKWKVLFHIRQAEEKLTLVVKFPKKPVKDFFRFGPFQRRPDEFFFMLTYYVLYYPLFWYLEEKRQTHALHASALIYRNKGVVICGLEGIGKTSLGLMFLKEEGTRFLSDNLVFYDRGHVYPCYELVRMHAQDDDFLWKDHFDQMNKFALLKGFFSPKFNASQDGIRPDIFIFPEFSSEFCVTPVSSKEAVARAISLSHLPSELNHYSEYRHLYNLLDLNVKPWESVYSALDVLLETAKCYRVGMPKQDGLTRNFERLKEAVFP
ncbi:MAG: hypothetical protein KC618_03000 [Candidatus Omnitrophica bacterium]|nr:hypothetical protein [Candidatus Omnitrophota bacterium]